MGRSSGSQHRSAFHPAWQGFTLLYGNKEGRPFEMSLVYLPGRPETTTLACQAGRLQHHVLFSNYVEIGAWPAGPVTHSRFSCCEGIG